jgi:arsenate reductase
MTQTVLILCTGNASRSLIAESILRHEFGGKVRVLSAGARPKSSVEEHALEALRLAGFATDGLFPKDLDAVAHEALDLVVTICDDAKETCPTFDHPVKSLHLPFHDPSGEPLESYIRVRDEMREMLVPRVAKLLNLT